MYSSDIVEISNNSITINSSGNNSSKGKNIVSIINIGVDSNIGYIAGNTLKANNAYYGIMHLI